MLKLVISATNYPNLIFILIFMTLNNVSLSYVNLYLGKKSLNSNCDWYRIAGKVSLYYKYPLEL